MSGRKRLTWVTALTIASLLIGSGALNALAEGHGPGERGGSSGDPGNSGHQQQSPVPVATQGTHDGGGSQDHHGPSIANTDSTVVSTHGDDEHNGATRTPTPTPNGSTTSTPTATTFSRGHGEGDNEDSTPTATPNTTTTPTATPDTTMTPTATPDVERKPDDENDDLVTKPARVTDDARPCRDDDPNCNNGNDDKGNNNNNNGDDNGGAGQDN
jgi:hypothetical protein